jgi:nucleoside-diphosphate-sugar epimerase
VNIAVFGGSGKVGKALLPVLLEQGHRITALQHHAPICVGAEIIEGSLTDAATVAKVIEGTDVVVQMTMRGNVIEQAVDTSVHGTINILDAILAQGLVRQYVLTSSDAACGIWSTPYDQPISHKTPPASYPGYYSLGKVLEETIVREYARNHKLPFTIARLSWVQQEDSVLKHFIAGYDPRRPTSGLFSDKYSLAQKQMLERGQPFVMMPVDKGGKPYRRTLVQRQDVVDGLLRMIDQPKAIGQLFHLSGPAFDYDKPCRYLAERMSLPVEAVMLDAHSFEIDCSHTTELLCWQPEFDVIAMIDASLAWKKAASR